MEKVIDIHRCCNPFQKDKHEASRKPTVKVTKSTITKAATLNITIVDAMYICHSCDIQLRKDAKQIQPSTENVSSDEEEVLPMEIEPSNSDQTISEILSDVRGRAREDSFAVPSATVSEIVCDRNTLIDKINQLLPLLGQPCLNRRELRGQKYVDEMLQDMTNAIRPILTGHDNSDVHIDNTDNQIIEELKTKFEQTADRIERYRILTTAPAKWSARKMRGEFGISADMAKRAQELIAVKGIMSAPTEKLLRPRFNEQIFNCVNNFYLDDENSRVCPGKRDYVTVNSLGVKEKKTTSLASFNNK